jgi:radical SAM-linked protein
VFRQRLRVRFHKQGLLRFISHRDLMRLFERALRRARLPLAMTQGYNPHPRLSFPLALATGMAGLNEVMEFQLSEWLPPAAIREALSAELPREIQLVEVVPVAAKSGATVVGIVYEVVFKEAPTFSSDDVAALMDREEIPVRRDRKGGTRVVDIRPFLQEVVREGARLSIRCRVEEGSTTRPEEVLNVLGVDVEAWLGRMTMTRTDTILKEPPARAGGVGGRGR